MGKLYDRMQDSIMAHDVTLENRLGVGFVGMGVVASFLSIFVCIISNVSLAGTLIVCSIFLFTPFVMGFSLQLKKPYLGRIIMVIGVIIAIPGIFLTSGGTESGCNLWFTYSLYYIILALKGKDLAIALGVAVALDAGCYFLDFFYPEYIYHLDSTENVFTSTVGSVAVVTFAICITAYEQKRMYRSEQEILIKQGEELAQANRYEREFLSNCSHELRSPLNAISGLDEMILRTDNIEEIRQYAMESKAAVETLLTTVNDILDFNKIDSGNMEIVCEDYSLEKLIRDCYNQVKFRARDKNLEFQVKTDFNIPSVLHGDAKRLKQIFINLLTNAVKYTEKGFLRLAVTYESIGPDMILLKVLVQDSGQGISKENQTKLFDSFKRLNLRQNRTIEGTGLGLSITKNLVELMQGQIQVNSELGEGSEFIVTIPQKIVDATPMGGFDKDKDIEVTYHYKEAFQAPDKRILAVDDMPINLQIIKGLMQKTKLQIDTAISGEAALMECQKKQYDLILLDSFMPNMSGSEVMQRMRQMGIDVPIIVLTADAVAGARESYIKEGFDDFLSKPVHPEELERMIGKYLRQL